MQESSRGGRVDSTIREAANHMRYNDSILTPENFLDETKFSIGASIGAVAHYL